MRVYNFSAGPACLSEEVLRECSLEMLDFGDTGTSVMEMSHRSAAFQSIIDDAEKTLRSLMSIPPNYKVLFLQGGGSLQFAMVALNLATNHKKAAYIDTGVWASKAKKEAERLGVAVDLLASSKDKNYSYIPRVEKVTGDYDYVYLCFNNTIFGTHYDYIPDTGSIPLVADISSCILSEPLDVSKFGLLFAGAQKNLGPAGVTIVIIREDLIRDIPTVPTMLLYKTHSDNGSMFNTPPCYPIYVVGKSLHWIEREGGVEGMATRNKDKAALLYNYLDNNKIFRATAEKSSRSLMNVPFVLRETSSDDKAFYDRFVQSAHSAGLVNLKGHRLVGGLRASIYNAMPRAGVEALVNFMESFTHEAAAL